MGGLATSAGVCLPKGIAVDNALNVFATDSINHRLLMIPSSSATYFGQSMTANYLYVLLGTAGSTTKSPDGTLASSAKVRGLNGVSLDASGNIYLTLGTDNRILMIPATSGTYFGQAMTANTIYSLAGSYSGYTGYTGDGGPGPSALLNNATTILLDNSGNLIFNDSGNGVLRQIYK